MKINIILITLFIHSVAIFAQPNKLFIPKNIQKAYNNQTRTKNGTVGDKYWQNFSNYTINVEFSPISGKVVGEASIVYYNHSPNNLNQLVLKMYPNLYQKGNIRKKLIDSLEIGIGMVIKNMSVNNKKINLTSSWVEKNGVNLIIMLMNGIPAGDSAIIKISWEYEMPKKEEIRMGKYGENTYMIAYWYPQLAVYDDINGWNLTQYNGLQEFYFDYANYDVKISVPENYIVWATGMLRNPENVLSSEVYERYKKALKSDELIRIISLKHYESKQKLTKTGGNNIWHFTADTVADFVFATSDNYLWDGISMKSFQNEDKRIFIQSAYNLKSKDFYEVTELAKDIINHLSTDFPAVPYPYPSMTVFNGEGGMEYPMFVNDGSCYTHSRTVFLTSHEITHTYFPFLTGINQEQYAWMDEGLTMLLPLHFQEKHNGNELVDAVNIIEYSSGKLSATPLMTPSIYLDNYDYYVQSYYHPMLAFYYIKDYIGDDNFKKVIQEFINRWRNKHPTPYDLFYTFDDVLKLDLSWYWKPWFFNWIFPDLEIAKIYYSENTYSIVIHNNGQLPLPLKLNITFNDGTKTTISEKINVWISNLDSTIITYKSEKKIKSITLGNSTIPDIEPKNNYFYTLD